MMRQAAVEPLELAAAETLAERLVRPESHVTGNSEAPVTVVEWADFQCPACSRAEATAAEIRLMYGDRVRFVFRHFPLERLHAHARKAAEASECAAEQGKFWEAVQSLFHHQEDLSEAALLRAAGELKLDVDRFRDCLASGRMAARVERDLRDARALGLRATPTFFIGRTIVEGPLEVGDFAKLLESELSRSSRVAGLGGQPAAPGPSPGHPAEAPDESTPSASKSPPDPRAAGTTSSGAPGDGATSPSFGGLGLGGSALTAFQASATTCSEEDLAKQQPNLIRTAEAREFFERKPSALFVDVRPRSQFTSGRIRNAINIPIEEIERRWSELPQDREVVLYESGRGRGDDLCAAAVAAGRVLLARGFSQDRVKVFQDGFAAWEKAGLPRDP
jgi:predicted DsbA family dithiol-disulfide isomerase/rhodanese-related sulfurtransferase